MLWNIILFSNPCTDLDRLWGLQEVGKVKVKCTLVQALRLCTGRTAHRGSSDIALPFLDHSTRRGWGVSVTLWPVRGCGFHILWHSAYEGGKVVCPTHRPSLPSQAILLVLICWRLSQRIMSMKNSIGNGSRDAPACSAVPQPTAPPLASVTDRSSGLDFNPCPSEIEERELFTRSIGTFIALIIFAFAIPAILFIFCMCFVCLFPVLC